MSTKKLLVYGGAAAVVLAVVFKVKLPIVGGFIGSGPSQDGKNPTGVVRGSA